MTSHDVVSRLRKITGEKSIGHLGTLDPMATGVLPLVLGKFTRLAQYFSSAEKSYSGAIRFGFATDTYDAEGEAAHQRALLLAPTATTDRLDQLADLARDPRTPRTGALHQLAHALLLVVLSKIMFVLSSSACNIYIYIYGINCK